MLRRVFLKSLAKMASILAASPSASATPTPEKWATLQTSPLAGFQFYEGDALWPLLAVGQPVELRREPANRHDARAVRVEWRGHMLGYLPRLDNAAVSQLLDRNVRLTAVISGLENSHNPWARMTIEVRWLT